MSTTDVALRKQQDARIIEMGRLGLQQEQLRASRDLANRMSPQKVADAGRLAREFDVPMSVYMDPTPTEPDTHPLDMGELSALSAKNAGMARWLADPRNLALAKDDLPSLHRIADHLRPKRGDYGGSLADAGASGVDRLRMMQTLSQVTDRSLTPEQAAKVYGEAWQRIQGRPVSPEATEGAKQSAERAKISEALHAFAGRRPPEQVAATAAMAAVHLHDIVVNPLEYLRSSVEQAPYSAPAFVGGLVGGVAGRVAGLPKIGMGLGAFAGGYATEYGSWLDEEVQNRLSAEGKTPADYDAVLAILSDEEFMAGAAQRATLKGLGTAGPDVLALFLPAAGVELRRGVGELGKPYLARLARQATRATGFEMLEEGATELSGRGLAKGGLTAKDIGEGEEEAFAAPGGAGLMDATLASIARTSGTTKRVVVETISKIRQADSDAAAAQGTAEAWAESKAAKRFSPPMRDLVNHLAGDRGVTDVRIPTAAWNAAYSKEGQSPAKALADVLEGGAKLYTDALKSGDVVIPFGTFVEKIGNTPEWDVLLPDVQWRPDGITLRQAAEIAPQLAEMADKAAEQAQEQVALEAERTLLQEERAKLEAEEAAALPPTQPPAPQAPAPTAGFAPEHIAAIEEPGAAQAETQAGLGAAPAKEGAGATPGAASFTPTATYQPVPEGTVLPPGLDIRMNLETGVNEARLMPAPEQPAPAASPRLQEVQKRLTEIEAKLLELEQPATAGDAKIRLAAIEDMTKRMIAAKRNPKQARMYASFLVNGLASIASRHPGMTLESLMAAFQLEFAYAETREEGAAQRAAKARPPSTADVLAAPDRPGLVPMPPRRPPRAAPAGAPTAADLVTAALPEPVQPPPAAAARPGSGELPAVAAKPAVQGRETVIHTVGGSYPAHYAVIEARNLIPSHVIAQEPAGGLEAMSRPDYEAGLQPRPYETLPEGVEKVNRMAREMKPELFLGDSATPTDGSPIITPDGTVLNGNARAMALQLAIERGQAGPYQDALAAALDRYGIDPASVAMENPVLVRVVDMHPASQEAFSLAREGNEALTEAQSSAQRMTALAGVLPPEALKLAVPEETTLPEVLAGDSAPARALLRRMYAALPPNLRPAFFTEPEVLSDAGKEAMAKLLLGSVVTPELAFSQRPSVQAMLTKAIPQLAAMQTDLLPSMNIRPALELALQFGRDSLANWTQPIEQGFLGGADPFGALPVEAQFMARFISANVRSDTALRRLIERYVTYSKGSETLGVSGVSPSQALDAAQAGLKGKESAAVPPPRARAYGESNQVFTRDAAEKAREVLRRKLNQANMGLDPELLQAGVTLAGYHIEAGARKFADFVAAMVADLGESVRPYLRSWYESARHYPGFDARGMTPAGEIDAPAVVAPPPALGPLIVQPVRGGPADVVPEHPRIVIREAELTPTRGGIVVRPLVPESGDAKADRVRAAAVRLSQDLPIDGPVVSWQQLQKMADVAFGGTMASGAYDAQDLANAVEFAVNRRILQTLRTPRYPATIKGRIALLEGWAERLPTQTRRAGEKVALQQFSTPPAYGAVLGWVANLDPRDTVLEPSAGTGSIAVHGREAQSNVHVNEIDTTRAALLAELGFSNLTRFDAEQLNNVLPPDMRFSVVLMNPPFSNAGQRGVTRDIQIGAKHVEQALKRLAPGGRLVAIVGRGMAMEAPAFRSWWSKIQRQYTVQASVGVSGDIYRRQGTAFETRVLVIDNTGPTVLVQATGNVDSLQALADVLQGVRDARPPVERPGQPAGAGGPEAAARGEPGPAGGAVRAPRVGGPGADVQRGTAEPAPAAGEAPLGAVPAVEGGPSGVGGVAGQPAEPGREGAAGRGLGGTAPPARADVTGEPVPAAGVIEPGQPRVEPQAPPLIRAEADLEGDEAAIYETYRPQGRPFPNAPEHGTPLVESAAMRSVALPVLTYKPALSGKALDGLSDAQLEAIAYAGQSHQELLPDGTRRGFMIGDGTGVGKGREVAGTILDNWNQGRKKAVWISKNKGLFLDATRDWTDLGGDPNALINLHKQPVGKPLTAKQGVLFLGYDLLKTKAEFGPAGQLVLSKPGARIETIKAWLGEGFDGVIAFDEAHLMGATLPSKGKRGVKDASARALAGLHLRTAFPKARILLLSATGATDVTNLGYLERFGLWGAGTPFASAIDFVNKIGQGSLANMEMVAREIKQMGLYIARSLSMQGVQYERKEHILTEEQTALYDRIAEAWRIVHQHWTAALGKDFTNASRTAKAAAMAQYWSTNLRFFEQVMISMQMPTVIAETRKDLAAKHAVVLQMVNHYSGRLERAMADRASLEDSDEDGVEVDIDISPKDDLIQMLKKGFPVQQYEEYKDPETGIVQRRPAYTGGYDADGKPRGDPVVNAEAVAMRDRLIGDVNELRIPSSPVDFIMQELGEDNVAEVTGRTQRVVYRDGRPVMVKRNPDTANPAEVRAFQEDRKKVLLFTMAGNTGASYHADLKEKNQRLRRHRIVQSGFIADSAIQGFGRTHRTRQRQAPEYILHHTNLPGHKRFISSIARRIEQMGALTKGQRQAGASVFSEKDNLEGPYGNAAVRALINDVAANRVKEINRDELVTALGLTGIFDPESGQVRDERVPPVTQFLNRMLSVPPARQELWFSEFDKRMEALIEDAIQADTYDPGMQSLKAKEIRLDGMIPVRKDPKTGAETRLYELTAVKDRPRVTWAEIRAATQPEDFFINKQSGVLWAAGWPRQHTTSRGGVEMVRRLYGPGGPGAAVEEGRLGSEFRKAASEVEAERLWNERYDATPATTEDKVHLLTGTLLPIWDRLPDYGKVWRVTLNDRTRLLGREVAEKDLAGTMERLGVDRPKLVMTPEAVGKAILSGKKVTLSNGWTLARRKVAGENRIEVTGPTFAHMRNLERAGVFMEEHAYKRSYFVPTGERMVEALRAVMLGQDITRVGGEQTLYQSWRDAGETELLQTAYHGTGADPFERFSERYIGSGQGAASFSWGLYFASAKAVGKAYRDEAARTSRAHNTFDGKRLAQKDLLDWWSKGDLAMRELARLPRSDFAWSSQKDLRPVVAEAIVDLEDQRAHLVERRAARAAAPEGTIHTWTDSDYRLRIEGLDERIKGLREAKERLAFVPEKRSGNIYTVELAPQEDEYLDWDKPISAQSEKVKAALTQMGLLSANGATLRLFSTEGVPASEMNAADMYDALVSMVNRREGPYPSLLAVKAKRADEQVSKWLLAGGIPGVRYLDQFSRAEGAGTSNYVIFDENLVTITEMEQAGQRPRSFDEAMQEHEDFPGYWFKGGELITIPNDMGGGRQSHTEWLLDNPDEFKRLTGRDIDKSAERDDVSFALIAAGGVAVRSSRDVAMADVATFEAKNKQFKIESGAFSEAQKAIAAVVAQRGQPFKTVGVAGGSETIILPYSEFVAAKDVRAARKMAREFMQGEEAKQPKGGLTLPNERLPVFTLTFYRDADDSTFFHEMWHYFFIVLGTIAESDGAPQQLKDDWATVLKELRVGSLSEMKREHHEYLAKQGEAYNWTGKAPSEALRRLMAAFADWIRNVYRTLLELGVEVNPRISEVMDRMLATDEEIAAARADSGHGFLAETPEEAAMDPEKYAEYRNAVQAALDEGWNELAVQMLADLTKERRERRREQQAKVRAEVEAGLDKRPETIALSMMTTGALPDGTPHPTMKGPVKLDRAGVVERYGAGSKAVRGLDKLGVLADSGGLELQAAVEAFGAGSPDELVMGLAAAANRDRYATALTRARMAAEHPDLLPGKERAAAAVKAIESPKYVAAMYDQLRAWHAQARREGGVAGRQAERAKEGEREAKAAAKAGAAARRAELGGIPRLQDIRAEAERQVGSLGIGRVQPHAYLRTARREGNLAIDRARVGDWAEAAAAQTRAILNHEMYRIALLTVDERESGHRYAAKLSTTRRRNAIRKAGQSFDDQLGALLARFELGTVSPEALQRKLALSEWIEEREQDGDPPLTTPAMKNEGYRKPWRDLTREEFADLVDLLEQIEHIAQRRNADSADGKKAAEDAHAAELVGADGMQRPPKPYETGAPTPGERRMEAVSGLLGGITKASTWARLFDGQQEGGPWMRWLRKVRHAADVEGPRLVSSYRGYVKLYRDHFTTEQRRDRNRREAIAGLNLSHEDRLSIGSLWGRARARQRLLYMYSAEQLQAILASLTDRDWDFIEARWKYLEQFWPEIVEQQRRVTGGRVEKSKPAPFTVTTADGHARELAGGYHPMAYKDLSVLRQDGEELFGQVLTGAAPSQMMRLGFQEPTLEKVMRPLRLDRGVVNQHIYDVVHALSMREALIDAKRLLNRRDVVQAVEARYGKTPLVELRHYLEVVGAGGSGVHGWRDVGLAYLRTGSVADRLWFRPLSALKQFYGLRVSMVAIGPEWFLKSQAKWITNERTFLDTWEWIKLDPHMKARVEGAWQRELNEVRSQSPSAARSAIHEYGFYMMSKAQYFVDAMTYLAQFEKSMATLPDSMDSVAKEREARAQAADMVRDTQGGGHAVDLSRWESDSAVWRLFTTFFTDASLKFQHTRLSMARNLNKNPIGWARFLGDVTTLFVLPAAVSAMAMALLSGDDDDDEDRIVENVVRKTGMELIDMLPIFRELSSIIGGYRGVRGPAGLGVIPMIEDAAVQLGQGEMDSAAWRSYNLLGGALLHYPGQTINDAAEAITQTFEGEIPTALIGVRGKP